MKAGPALQCRHIGIGGRHIARLHVHQVFGGQLAGVALDGGNEVHQLHWLVVADVEDAVRCMAVSRAGLAVVIGRVGQWRTVQRVHDAGGNIVDKSEITYHLAVVEHLDRLSGQDGAGEHEQRHVGAAPRPVDREKAQPGGWQAKQVAVSVGHQLVGLLGGRVKADRVIHTLLFRKRHHRVATVDAGA